MCSSQYSENQKKRAVDYLRDEYLHLDFDKTFAAHAMRYVDIKQDFIPVEKERNKLEWLKTLVGQMSNGQRMLVLTSRQVTAQSIPKQLRDQYPSIEAVFTHGELKQADRERVMHEFKQKRRSLLVATQGLASRGVNFPSLDIVVDFDMPETLADYKAAIGRVGRIGNEGNAITFLTPEDMASSTAASLKEFLVNSKVDLPEGMEAEASEGKLDEAVAEAWGDSARGENDETLNEAAAEADGGESARARGENDEAAGGAATEAGGEYFNAVLADDAVKDAAAKEAAIKEGRDAAWFP